MEISIRLLMNSIISQIWNKENRNCEGGLDTRSYLAQIPMILLADQEPEKPEESNNDIQDNAGHHSPAIANAPPVSPPVDRKDMSSNGNNSPVSGGNIFRSNTYLTWIYILPSPCFAYYHVRLYCPPPALVDYVADCMHCRPMMLDCLALCMDLGW